MDSLVATDQGTTMPKPSRPNRTDEHVGAQIRTRRMMLGMSQTTLADAADITFQQVQKYEKGTNRVSASRMQQFSKILDVPISFFFEGAPEAEVRGGGKPKAKGAITPAYVTWFVSSRDGVKIMKAFHRIADRSLRRKIVDLAHRIANSE